MGHGENFLEEQGKELRYFLYEMMLDEYREDLSWEVQEVDGGTMELFEKKDWGCGAFRMNTGYPCSETVFVTYREKPCYSFHLWGDITAGVNPKMVEECLREALSCISTENPWCGPRKLACSNGLRYETQWMGDLRHHYGVEKIFNGDGCLLYYAEYSGGVLNLI